MQRHREAFRGVKDGEEQDRMGRSKRSRKQRKKRRGMIQKNEEELGCLTCVRLPPLFP